MMYCVEIWMGANEEHRGLISPVVYLTFFNANLNELIQEKIRKGVGFKSDVSILCSCSKQVAL